MELLVTASPGSNLLTVTLAPSISCSVQFSSLGNSGVPMVDVTSLSVLHAVNNAISAIVYVIILEVIVFLFIFKIVFKIRTPGIFRISEVTAATSGWCIAILIVCCRGITCTMKQRASLLNHLYLDDWGDVWVLFVCMSIDLHYIYVKKLTLSNK